MSNLPLNFVIAQNVSAQEISALGRHSGDLFWCNATTATANTTWVNVAGISFDIVKQFTNTSLLIQMSLGVYTNAIAANIEIGVTIAGVTTVIAHQELSEVNITNSVAGLNVAAPAAGSWSVQPVMHRVSGSGTITADIGAPLYICIREVLV